MALKFTRSATTFRQVQPNQPYEPDKAVSDAVEAAGKDGWELVSYQAVITSNDMTIYHNFIWRKD